MPRERDDARTPNNRRIQDDEFAVEDDSPTTLARQAVETLREGYSWIRALEIRHPGWHLAEVTGTPFAPLRKKLGDCRVALVSFAGVYRKGQKPFSISPGLVPAGLQRMRFKDCGDWSVREISKDCDPLELEVAHAHYDHSEAQEDINCIFPLTRLVELELDGYIGECAERHYSLMGYVPEVARVVETVRQKIIPALERLKVDAVLVSGGCELSHQSAGLAQREIEAAGIATVAVSVCRDITERLRVPRAVALRFPLGNPFGAPLDHPTQSRILRDALSLLETARNPGEILGLPYDWIKT